MAEHHPPVSPIVRVYGYLGIHLGSTSLHEESDSDDGSHHRARSKVTGELCRLAENERERSFR